MECSHVCLLYGTTVKNLYNILIVSSDKFQYGNEENANKFSEIIKAEIL